MTIRAGLLALLAGAALAAAPAPVQAQDQPAPASFPASSSPAAGALPGTSPDERPDAELCHPGTPDQAPPTTEFVDDNPLLGPAELPAEPPVGPLVEEYSRTGGLATEEFLAEYTAEPGDGYVYPPGEGFVLRPDGLPLRFAQTLQPGFRIDRFGFPGGRFLAPLGTPFGQRSITPAHLNTPEAAPASNYHVYCVLEPFTVATGAVAPWFAQPGLGTQYVLEPDHLPEAGGDLSVKWLLDNGYLVEERPGAADAGAAEAAVSGTTPGT